MIAASCCLFSGSNVNGSVNNELYLQRSAVSGRPRRPRIKFPSPNSIHLTIVEGKNLSSVKTFSRFDERLILLNMNTGMQRVPRCCISKENETLPPCCCLTQTSTNRKRDTFSSRTVFIDSNGGLRGVSWDVDSWNIDFLPSSLFRIFRGNCLINLRPQVS